MTYLTRCVFAWALALCLVVSPVWAQGLGPDYTEWDQLAQRVEADLERGDASNARLESWRSDVVVWRDRFLAAQGDNDVRLGTLQSQLKTLGPAPVKGLEEAAEISSRRADLLEKIARLSTPGKQAVEAFTHADGIVSEIDQTIRNRQADALLKLGPSPMNPAYWPLAIADLSKSLALSFEELAKKWAAPSIRENARAQLPAIIMLLFIGFMLISRGRKFALRLANAVQTSSRRGRRVLRFLVSLGQVFLPLAGVYAATQAFVLSGLAGPRWTLFLEHIPIWFGILLGIHWLSQQAFHNNDEVAVLQLAPDERGKAQWFCDVLAVLYVAHSALVVLTQFDNYSVESLSVAEFPLLVLSGYYLFRLGRVRNDAAMAGTAAARELDAGVFRLRLARLLGRAAMFIGVIGPVMAAIGYTKVGYAAIYPTIASLSVVGLVFVFQAFFAAVYATLRNQDEDTEEGLLPVLAGVALTLLALPALALIWGARMADLTELWSRFREGFLLGDTRISPTDFILVVIIFVLGYMLTRLLQGALRSSVLPRTKIDQGGRNAIVSGVGYVGIFLAAVISVTIGGLDLSSLAIVAGALSVGIGFGLQNIVSNFVSGIILLIERPISEGDWIEVNGTHGTVRDISVRSTRIETFDRYDMIVPNADIVSGVVSNYTRGNVLGRVIVPVGVAYGTDTRKVEKILMNIARDHDMVLMNPAPSVVFKAFGADSMDFEIRAILRDINQGLSVRTEINHQIVERFAAEGIEIPFAQRDIWIRNPEVLPGATPPKDESTT
ncbi:DUF3772 domain-containing protein [Pelagimonas varians]|uniref:Putative MscS family protein.1 n=1 Tax=Pelagimonas varians TaxID=696760 RepID=A0A238JVJ4_9RHOB|nr:DUF3772 domain-containing protein [Pelagimonas varians]PYG34391.1 small-conductance mechanosensitive channel [Pelagimonas varians]SMX34207.1 putative MscS family protein.1 precursor [Pelagimonas varians]